MTIITVNGDDCVLGARQPTHFTFPGRVVVVELPGDTRAGPDSWRVVRATGKESEQLNS